MDLQEIELLENHGKKILYNSVRHQKTDCFRLKTNVKLGEIHDKSGESIKYNITK